MAQALESPWRMRVCWICALLLGLLFVVSGGWKLLYPLLWSAALLQFKVPAALTIPGTLALGIAEIFGGILLIVPRFRRWGAFTVSALLLLFMGYMGFHYSEFKGMDCTCFPLLKRTVGPEFFIGDAVMLLMALAAWRWAIPPASVRTAGLVFASVCVFAAASYGVTAAQQSGIQAPPSLSQGRIFLFFFDPECTHCLAAAKQMSGYRWNDVKVVVVPTRVPQFAQQFLSDSGMSGKSVVNNDLEALRAIFKFVDPPYGAALDQGRQKAAFPQFDETEPRANLKAIGFIE